uniref:Fibronectin type-III domain-containing protein n=1 Tax=Hymenolepis diminuta TaxID=6216 RepID=A0A0R3SP19_HYMDI
LTITWDTNALETRGAIVASCIAIKTTSKILPKYMIKSAAKNEKCSIMSLDANYSYNVFVLEEGTKNQTVTLGVFQICPSGDHLGMMNAEAISSTSIKLTWKFKLDSTWLINPMNLSCKKVGHSAPVFTETLGNTTTNVTVNNLEEDTAYLCTINTTANVPAYNQPAVCGRSNTFSAITTKRYPMKTTASTSVELVNDTSAYTEFDEQVEGDGEFGETTMESTSASEVTDMRSSSSG